MKNVSLLSKEVSVGVFVVVSFIILALVGFLSLPGEASADSMTKSPTTFGTLLGTALTNPGNITASDNLYTETTLTGNSTSGLFGVGGFGFNIPDGATIDGIEVAIERHQECVGNGNCSTSEGIRENTVIIAVSGIQGEDNKASATAWPLTDTVVTYGGPTDLWGTTDWTPAQINAIGAENTLNDTGVAISVSKNGGGASRKAMLDHITMTVYYTLPPAATNPPTLNVGENPTDTVDSGSDITIPFIVDFTDPATLGSISVDITWDPAKLTFKSGAGSMPGGFVVDNTVDPSFDPSSGLIHVSGASSLGATTDFTLYTLVLTANATDTLVETDVEADITVSADETSSPLDMTARNLAVTINAAVIADTEAPVITVPSDITLEATSSAGAVATFTVTALDAVEGPVVADCDADSGDTFPLGETTVNCSASDSVPNTANASFKITVQDTTDPVITLNGSNPQTVLLGGNYDEAGAAVTDNYDENIEVDISGSVNTNTVGTYEITYNATDSEGNVAETKTRTVNVVDQEAPVITLLGANPQIIEVGSDYEELGATVEDNNDDLSAVIDATNVNTSLLGTYTVTYDATDSSGNAADTVERTVEVVDTTIPVITLTGEANVNLIVGDSYTDAGATASDNYDGDITEDINEGGTFVNTSTVGTFTITYDVEDSSGNAALQVTRTITVAAAPIEGCTNPEANNHDPLATVDDGSCEFPPAPEVCEDPAANNQGDPLPCTFDPAPEVCEDETANNVGEELPCTFDPAPEEEEDEDEEEVSTQRTTGSSRRNVSSGEVLGAEDYVFTLNMKIGSRGLEVMELQKKLNALGFGPLVVDGIFGPMTKAAVVKFQTANPPLVPDGIVGPLTRAVLNNN